MQPSQELPCPHCTFLNPAKRVKCSMCLKHLRKRDRAPPSGTENEPSTQHTSRSSDNTGEADKSTSERESHANSQLSDELRSSKRKKRRTAAVSSSSSSTATPQVRPSASLAVVSAEPLLGIGESVARGSGSPRTSVEGAARNRGASSTDRLPHAGMRSRLSTAAGVPIKIRDDSRKGAEEEDERRDCTTAAPVSSDENDAETSASFQQSGHAPPKSRAGPLPPPEVDAAVAPTLFSTAAGAPVTVSKASLAAAQRRWREANLTDDAADDTADSSTRVQVGPTETATRTDPRSLLTPAVTLSKHGTQEVPRSGTRLGGARCFQPPRPSGGAVRPDLIQVAPSKGSATVGANGARRAFVPPQQREPEVSAAALVARERVAGNVYPDPVRPSLSSRPMNSFSIAQSKLCAISFPYKSYRSAATSGTATNGASAWRCPPLSELASGAFQFHRSDCGPALAVLLGLTSRSLPPTTLITVANWRQLLLSLGASESHCTSFWCREMVLSSLLQLHELCTAWAATSGDRYKRQDNDLQACCNRFDPTALALLLCLRYNREIVDGERPALRRLMEGDIPPASLMVLLVSAVSEDRAAPHIRIVHLADGFYHVRASLDVALSSLVRERILVPGRRVAVCGARLLVRGQGTPEEFAGQTIISVNYNCVRPVMAGTPLGLGLAEPAPLPIQLVHPQGGLVPALRGVVTRVLPAFYVSQSVEGVERRGGSSFKLVRNKVAQMAHYSAIARALVSRHKESTHSAGGDSPTGVREGEAAGLRVSRVLSILLRSTTASATAPADALIQHWESCDDEEACARGAMTDEDSDTAALPKEGTEIVLYALNPARSQVAAAPFAHAKLFYASRTLHFSAVRSTSPNAAADEIGETPQANSLPDISARRTYLRMASAEELTLGSVVDVLGLCLGSRATAQGTLSLLLLLDDTYVLFQVPLPTATREVLLPLPASGGEEPFLLLLQNGTFISHEDSQVGSDCARVFASEYTLISTRIQRIAGPAVGAVLSETTLLELKSRFQQASRKHLARRDEIFRCCVEEASPSFPAGPTRCSTVECPPLAGTIATAPMQDTYRGRAALGGSSGVSSGGAASLGEKRLPYYLRSRSSGVSEGVPRPRGVFIPSHSTAPTTMQPPVQAANSTDGATEKFHFYGNVVMLELVASGDTTAEQHVYPVFNEAAKSLEHCAVPAETPLEGFAGVRVTWRYATLADTRSAVIRDCAVLESMLAPCISAQRLSYLCGSERQPQLAQQRSEALTGAKATPGSGAWWALFRDSVLSGEGEASTSTAVPTSGNLIPWAVGEWQMALQIIQEKLTGVLFNFTVGNTGSTIEKVFYIRDHFRVEEMFA